MVKLVVVLAFVAACQGQGREGGGVASGSAVAVQPPPAVSAADGRRGSIDAAAIVEPGSDEEPRIKPEEPETVDVGKAIADLGAVPAWQAVVDRAQYLARRGQHGVVFGTIGPAILVPGPPPGSAGDAGVGKLDGRDLRPAGSAAEGRRGVIDAGLVPSPYVWLVDDTEGNGALGIRVMLGAKAAQLGDRVALGGAWLLDADRKWYWKVDALSPLPAAPATELKEPAAPVGHVIASGELPSGARTISVAKDGDAVYFQLVGPPPAIDGDGWPVADQLGNPVYALLNLPGERASYGAQDLRAPDERWQLKRGQTYWVRIGHLHKHGADKPVTVNARTAPVRVM